MNWRVGDGRDRTGAGDRRQAARTRPVHRLSPPDQPFDAPSSRSLLPGGTRRPDHLVRSVATGTAVGPEGGPGRSPRPAPWPPNDPRVPKEWRRNTISVTFQRHGSHAFHCNNSGLAECPQEPLPFFEAGLRTSRFGRLSPPELPVCEGPWGILRQERSSNCAARRCSCLVPDSRNGDARPPWVSQKSDATAWARER